MNQPLAVKGGIGDFLQCLPFMLAHPDESYLVASHHERVREFFAALGLAVQEMPLGRMAGVPLCPRSHFFDGNPFPTRAPLFAGRRPVLGIHLGGSDYSLSVEARFGFPSKALPRKVFDAVRSAVGAAHDIILFGAEPELDALIPGWWEDNDEHFEVMADSDVTVSLSYVAQCSSFVGSDSAFKTMSAMLRIPTVVWVGDYKDAFRDGNFIDPYVESGVMSVLRYKSLSADSEVMSGVDFSVRRLRATADVGR